MDPRIHSARIRDAADIVRLIRGGFASDDLRLFIYGCRGIRRYVAAEIRGAAGSRNPYLVASLAGTVVGCLDLRRTPDGCFLNYIAVVRAARSRGVGARLLERSLTGEASDTTPIELDVFEHNPRAIQWYQRLGFERRGGHAWFHLTSAARRAGQYSVEGWPQANVAHRQFGFSRFALVTNRGRHDVGRLGSEWFRVASREAVEDPQTVPALRAIDPRRRVLAILRQDGVSQLHGSGIRALRQTARLSALVDPLLIRLRSLQVTR